jgi:hypothetical protein
MVLAHVGPTTRLAAIAHFPYVLSAAEPFVLLSGLVLGLRVARGAPPETALGRAGRLWGIHCTLMFAVLIVHEATGQLRSPSVEELGGWLAALWKVPALRAQSLDYMNILPLFVVFFAAAPWLVGVMRAGHTAPVVAASVALWLVTQWRVPFRFTDPACGPEAFVLSAWQLLFVLGVAVGLHAERVRAAWLRHVKWTLPALLGLFTALFVLAQLQRAAFAASPLHLPPTWALLTEKERLGPGRVLYDLVCMATAYAAFGWVRQRAPRLALHGLAPLELLGSRSLYSFLVHLAPALLASGLGLHQAPRTAQELAAGGAVGFVYLMARYHVLGRIIPS